MNHDTAAHQTAKHVTALEGALADAGHDVEVPSNPTVGDLERLCDLLGVRVSELAARIEGRDCPAWCVGVHPEHDPAHHVGALYTCGDVTLSLGQGLGQPVRIFVPDDVADGVAPERARALGAALQMAARMTGDDEGGQS